MNKSLNIEKSYIIITQLPVAHQQPFKDWLHTRTVPIIEEEGINKDNCAWRCDYENWLSLVF